MVVIGAGLAGLTAAYRLHKAEVDVALYEARNRVGGRVLTVNIEGHSAELGAQNIIDGGGAININALIDEFGLERVENQIKLHHYYYNGEDLTAIQDLLKKHQFKPQEMRKRLQKLIATSHNMKEILDGIFEEKDPLYKVMAVRLSAYEGAPIEKLSVLYAETLFHMLMGGVCFVHQVMEEEEKFMNLVSIKGGNALLPERIAESLGTRIHLKMPLTQVSKGEDDTFLLTFNEGSKVQADILILAMPCSVYEKIIFEEGLIPLDRLASIQSVQYGTNAKILVPFSRMPSEITGVLSDKIVSFFNFGRNILTLYFTGATSLFCEKTIQNSYTQASALSQFNFRIN